MDLRRFLKVVVSYAKVLHVIVSTIKVVLSTVLLFTCHSGQFFKIAGDSQLLGNCRTRKKIPNTLSVEYFTAHHWVKTDLDFSSSIPGAFQNSYPQNFHNMFCRIQHEAYEVSRLTNLYLFIFTKISRSIFSHLK